MTIAIVWEEIEAWQGLETTSSDTKKAKLREALFLQR